MKTTVNYKKTILIKQLCEGEAAGICYLLLASGMKNGMLHCMHNAHKLTDTESKKNGKARQIKMWISASLSFENCIEYATYNYISLY